MGKRAVIGNRYWHYKFKGALFNRKGEEVASASMRHQVSHPQPGWAEHDAGTDMVERIPGRRTPAFGNAQVSAGDIFRGYQLPDTRSTACGQTG